VNYGFRLENGLGTAVNIAKAAEYYKMAADQGNSTGQCNYAVCLEPSRGVVKDLEKATAYY
jgi:TPR repeat protein